MAIHLRIRRYGRMNVRLAEENYLAVGLRNLLAPQVPWEGCGGGAHDTDEVVLPRLDCFLGHVAAMIVREYELVCHAR